MARGPLKFYLAANLSYLLHGSKIPLGYKYLVPKGHVPMYIPYRTIYNSRFETTVP